MTSPVLAKVCKTDRKRGIKRTLAACAALLCVAATISLQAQGGNAPHLDASGMFVNPSPVPVAVLLVHRQGDVMDRRTVLQIEAHGQVTAGMPAGSTVENLVPLDAAMPLPRPPTCSAGAGSMRLTPSLVHEEMAVRAHADAANARDQEQLASARAAIELEQYFDEARTERSDPLRAELHSELVRDASPQGAAQIARNDQQQQNQQVLADTLAMVVANGQAISAHSEAAVQEAQALHAMVESKAAYLVHLNAVYEATQAMVNAGRTLNDTSAARLHSAEALGRTQFEKVSNFGRVCSGAALNRDMLAVTADAPGPLSVLLATAHFDHGGEEHLVFRRVRGTEQWIASIYWPLEAARATVRMDAAPRKPLGEVNAGRRSVKDELASTHKALAPLKRAERSARYASEGGDEGKTVILP